MSGDWVIVADGSEARFMVFGWHDGPRRGALRLLESSQLSNPECTVSGRRDGRKIKSGYDSTSYQYTDHREQHDAELHRRFASRIGRQTHDLALIGDVSAITVVTTTRMMGLLQSALQPVARIGISIRTLQRDYTWCTPAQIQQHLSENGLIPMHYETKLTELRASRRFRVGRTGNSYV
jgi:protein required for attachment to host cells